MKNLIPYLTLTILLISCTAPMKWENTLTEQEKSLFKLSAQNFQKLIGCSQKTEGNDAAFSAECTPLFAKEKLLVKFRQLETTATGHRIVADIQDNIAVACYPRTSEVPNSVLAGYKKGDNLNFSGMTIKLVTSEKKMFSRKSYTYVAEISPCQIY